MTAAYEYRYTDRDVRENPYLLAAAEQFLRMYGGDYEFLVNAQRFLAEQGSIPTGTARGVLNCMRNDPNWAKTLQPPVPRARFSGLTLSSHASTTETTLSPVDTRRPARVRLNATFKKPYVMSTWKSAYLVHILHNDACILWWYPHTETYQAVLESWCKLGIGRREHLVLTDFVPSNKTLCTRCKKAREEGNSSD